MNLQLTGLHAVVTGGSCGIGAAIVHALAAEGCRVSFCARRQVNIDKALDSLTDLPAKVQAKAVDVTDSAHFFPLAADARSLRHLRAQRQRAECGLESVIANRHSGDRRRD